MNIIEEVKKKIFWPVGNFALVYMPNLRQRMHTNTVYLPNFAGPEVFKSIQG